MKIDEENKYKHNPKILLLISIIMFLNIINMAFHLERFDIFEKSAQLVMSVSMAYICLISTFVLFLSLTLDKIRNKTQTSIFQITLISLYLLLLSDIVRQLYPENANHYIKYFLESSIYIFNYILVIFLKLYINSKVINKNKGKKIFNNIYFVIIGFCILLILTNPFTKFIFYYNDDGLLVQSKNIWFIGASIIFFMLANSFIVLFYSKLKLYKKVSFLSSTILIIIPICIFYKKYDISLIDIGFFISILIIYSNVHLEERIELEHKNFELAQANTNVMLSQIQPHFMYNSLATISALCDIDPSLAQNGIDRFSNYLRMNLMYIKSHDNIPFTKELEHIQTYLWLEQMRFGERLKVIYNTEFVDFEIPPLLIQPIVENAVKHGILKKTTGGTITISSKIMQDFYVITIEDDGVGFNIDNAPEGNGAHIGMENVKERLINLCNGRIEINSEIGKGTIVTIQIPDKSEKKK